jgi:peptidyl-prolyl cis-trans isomerase C
MRRKKRITKLKTSFVLSFALLIILALVVYISSNKRSEGIVATLNEKPIYKDELLEDISYIIGEDFNGQSLTDIPKEVLESIIIESKVSDKVYREALRDDIDEEEKIKKMVKSYKKQLIIGEFIKKTSNEAVTDEQVVVKYEELVEILKGQEERKIKHILLDSEDDAERAIREIRRTGSFERVAKRKSLDNATAADGGELGYVLKDQLAPEFSEVAFILKEGAISKPVKTTYGWHVIKIDDVREAQPAEFEAVREQIKSNLIEQKKQEYLQGIAQTLKVEILLDYNARSIDSESDELESEILFDDSVDDDGESVDEVPEEDEFELNENEVLNASEIKEEI